MYLSRPFTEGDIKIEMQCQHKLSQNIVLNKNYPHQRGDMTIMEKTYQVIKFPLVIELFCNDHMP